MISIKKIIKPVARTTYHKLNGTINGKKLINLIFLFQKINRKNNNLKETSLFAIKNINQLYSPSTKLNQGNQIKELLKQIKITIPKKGFIYSLDELKYIIHKNKIIDNISVDYSIILDRSLEEIKSNYDSKLNITENKNLKYLNNQINLIEGIELLINKEINELNNSKRGDKEKYISYLENIKNNKVNSFEEALQRILFFNQILWQTGHGLNGLGRLDKILENKYYDDLDKNIITKEKGLKLIKDFLTTLHEYYWYKSSALMGDTGQIIILGGKEENGNYFYNELTSLFIQAIKELNLPDPKILLRVSDKTPRFLIEKSLESMNTGVGSPLLSNDEKVIPNLINFGYDSKDAHNYVVSACWEPAPIGKGMEVNNVNTIIFLKPLNQLLANENLEQITDFDSLIQKYKEYLKIEIKELINNLKKITWEEDPLLSMFIADCDEKQLDISKGGAKYNNIGITSVSLGNTINSLINIKDFVFKNKKYSLEYLNNHRENNFENNEELLFELKNQKNIFGTDNEEVIQLSNEITNFVSELFNKNHNNLNGKFKFGLSAPGYISGGQEIKASLDGRQNFEPFNTHISLDSEKQDYTELMRFASKLDYTNARFNGNVVDFMVTPNFIKDNFDKFVDFLIISEKLGYFQMQMNVVSSDILIKAKANPNKYPNLIVRVWGFSAYFNDLPLDYKDLLIQRALKNEGKI